MKRSSTGGEKCTISGCGCLSQAPDRSLWLVLAGGILLCFLNYCYEDLQLIIRHSLNIWELIGQGKLDHFYRVGCQSYIGNSFQEAGEVPYDFWVYIPFAIWNLPVFIWEKMTGLTFELNYIALLWAKSGLMIPFFGCLYALGKISELLDMNPDQSKWLCYLFSSSLFLMNGLFGISQIDIVNTFFMLMGLYAYLRNREKEFLIWMMLAVTWKVFALIVFIPIIVLREKRIFHIIKEVAISLILTLLSKIIFFYDKLGTPTAFDERRFLMFIFDRKIELSGEEISLFVLAYFLLLVWCWNTRCKEEKRAYYVVWTMCAAYACFFLGAQTYPYWAVVFSPFIPLLIMMFPSKAKILLWMETIASAAYFVKTCVCDYGWIYSAQKSIKWMLLGIINGRAERGIDISEFYRLLGEDGKLIVQTSLVAIVFGSVIAVLALTYPKNLEKAECLMEMDKGSIWGRLIINLGCILLPMALYML